MLIFDANSEGENFMDYASLTNTELLREYKKCIAILCGEELTTEVNGAIPVGREIEKELLKRMG